MDIDVVPIFVFAAAAGVLAVTMLIVGRLLGPSRNSRVKEMPYESGMDPVHDARRRFDVRFYLVAIAFLVFDVELLFLYPWAVASSRSPEVTESGVGINAAVEAGMVSSREMVFGGFVVFFLLLVLGLIYDWRKGVFRWR